MPVMVTVKIEGLERVMAKLNGSALYADPMRRFLTAAALAVEGQAKPLTPVWRGDLRRAISHQVDHSGFPTFAKVGVLGGQGQLTTYAQVMEEGRKPGAKAPPVAAIAPWARAKGLNPFLVARSIGRKGIKARRFLRGGFERARGTIDGLLQKLARDIETQWGGR